MGKNVLLMKIAPVPAYERERIKALNDYSILDSLPESDFDDIADMASMICHAPIALISFIDANRQWFKSRQGIAANETSRDHSFGAHAINFPDQVLVIEDLSKDERFSNDPFVTGIPYVLFYAGVPLVNPDGFVLGTLSVLDMKPNSLDGNQIKALQTLGKQVVAQLELRKKDKLLRQKQADLNLAQTDLEQIAFLASHDLKTPLNNILSLVDLLKSEYGNSLGEDGNEYIQYLTEAAAVTVGMISGILSFSRAAKYAAARKETIVVEWLINDVKDALIIPDGTTLTFSGQTKHVVAPHEALRQIMLNLLRNAIQYTDKRTNQIDIIFLEVKSAYVFEVRDNGEGIAGDDMDAAFALFKRLRGREKTTENMGLGLAIVKRILEKLGGRIQVDSIPGSGTAVTFTIPK